MTAITARPEERWAEIEAVFTAALEAPPEERESLIASRCSDESVRAEVRRLLARHDSLAGGQRSGDVFLAALDAATAAVLLESRETTDPERLGRYQILRRLGRGATGVVYLARDPVLGRPVALKLLSPSLSSDPSAARRFGAEARAASALDHPHIATVYELGRTDDDRFFIAMEYLEGETLRDRIGRGALPVKEAVRIASEIADALSAAHGAGIVHRDIKPENIILSPGGACIVDFGIAKIVGYTLTGTGTALGTAAYMSPEQTRGLGVDHRSDIWSLGVVLYEMLTGNRPFQADAGEALVYAIRHDPPGLLETGQPGRPSALARAVTRCLEKDPARRYQSAGDLLDALSSSLSESDSAQAVGPRWKHLGFPAGAVALAALVFVPVPPSPTTRDQLPANQLSTVVPLVPRPGAIAILSPTELQITEPGKVRQYLTEGISEALRDELIRVLSATEGIRVSSPLSVRILAQAGADVDALNQRLAVSAVLRWNLGATDSLISVDAQLIRASDGEELWSEVFERPVGEAGAIVEDIRRPVMEALGFGGPSSAAGRPATEDLSAYDLYLRGIFAHNRSTPAGLDEAESLFRQAISLDTAFALAYTWLAQIQISRWSGAPADRLQRVKPLIARALELDSTSALAHRTAGYVAAWQDHDWARAARHFSRALELDSSDVWNYHFRASHLAAIGRPAEAAAMARRAAALDPLSSVTATQIGFYLYVARQYAEAIAVLERALQLDTTSWTKMPITLGRAYLGVGRYDDAIAQFRRAGLESSGGFEGPALLAYALGLAGRAQELRPLAAQYIERARGSSARPLDLVAVHLGLGDTAQALDWIEQLPEDRGSRFFLLSDRTFDPLRGSPRFQRVLERLNLTGGRAVSRSDGQ